MKLTKKLVDAAKHPTRGQRFLRDEELRGFAVRLTPRSKTFVLEKEINGRVRRLSLGRFGPLTVDQARDLAKVKIGEIAKGGDPAEERQTRRQSATWVELEELYLQRHAVHNKSIDNDRRNLRLHLAFLRPRRLDTLTQADFSGLHADLGAAGHRTGANAVLALVKSMLNRGREWGLLSGDNPARNVRKFKLQPRERFVTPMELPKLWAAMKAEPNPYVKGAFFVGLLTGARRSEVLGMRWTDLDLQQALWRIPDTKAGRPHTVPLPSPVIDELLKLPRLDGNPFVFCGRWGKSHLVNVSKPWKRIRHEAGLDDCRIHDLRRTLGSWLVAAGASLPVIGKALNHSQAATTQIYARLQIDAVRQALDANATNMLTVIEQAKERDHAT